MATLQNKTDEIAALETLRTKLAQYEKALEAKKDSPEKVKNSIKAQIANIRKQIREGKTTDREVSAKQLANALLSSRKKFLEMSKKDFNGVIRQLSKKPEYAFLKGMSRDEVVRDINRKAKPVGWRFKGRENYKTPTPAQVRRGRALGTVYYENRPNRSDVSQTKQLARGGGVKSENLPYCIYVTNIRNPNQNSNLVAKVKAKGDALIITSELNRSLAPNTPLVYTMKEKMYEDGGSVEPIEQDEKPVIRYYFEDEAYEYEGGGEIDIDDLNIPVHYTMFEDEMYEYARGGYVSKGEMVWGKLSQSKRMEFLNKHFTPQITPRSQETLVGKNWNFLPKNVKIKFQAVYANIEDY